MREKRREERRGEERRVKLFGKKICRKGATWMT
jgi:hypothetical protein